MKHQIALVGGQLLPIYIGIVEFKPDRVYLIVSDESKPKVSLLRALIPGITCTEETCDPFEFNSIKAVCDRILDSIGSEDEVQINLTGGTKIMVLATQALIIERKLNGFYVNQNGTLLKVPTYQTQKLKSDISVKEFLEISGHKLSNSKTLSDFSTEDFASATEIRKLCEKKEKTYFSAMSRIRGAYERLSAIPLVGSIPLNKSSSLKWQQNRVTIIENGSDIFNIESPSARSLFFSASWWELVVAKEISKWSKAKELLIQCELPFRTDTKTMKNEIDVLVNVGGKLIFVECKSGIIRQEDINKMKIVKDTYGGVISKSLLASRFAPSETILEKCRELNIEVFYMYDARRKVNPLSSLVDALDILESKLAV
jgi:hypothetical protein